MLLLCILVANTMRTRIIARGQRKIKLHTKCKRIVEKHLCDNQFILVNFYGYIFTWWAKKGHYIVVMHKIGLKFSSRNLFKMKSHDFILPPSLSFYLATKLTNSIFGWLYARYCTVSGESNKRIKQWRIIIFSAITIYIVLMERGVDKNKHMERKR